MDSPISVQINDGAKPQKRRRANDPSRKRDKASEIVLPIAEETERQVLGTFLLVPESFEKAIEAGLTTRLFALRSHQTIYAALLDMRGRSWEFTPKTISDYLQSQHKLEQVGGMAYIASLIDGRYAQPERLSGLIKQLEDVNYKREATKRADELRLMASNGATPAEIEDFLDGFQRTHVGTKEYMIAPTGMFLREPSKFGFGFENKRLTNFAAKIVRELIEDDGSSEEQRIFEMEITLKNETRRIEVPSSKFLTMAWPTSMLGAEATVWPGKADQARCAIQLLSPVIQKKTVYAHTGWRRIEDQWAYLHGGGAITGTGNRNDVSVRLPHSMRFFLLPSPATKKDVPAAYKSALDLLDAFPLHLTVPVLGAIWAAICGDPDYSVYVTGQSGCFKSELTGIAQSFFGAGFNRVTMPANWDDTANVLHAKSFTAKDAVMVIDDFAPNGLKRHDEELHAKAERVFRAAGNRTGKGRLQSDMSERISKEPRGMLVCSGEDLPRGMSLQARLLIVPIEKGEIKSAALSTMQRKAAAGDFALSLSTFLSHFARNYENIKRRFDDDRISFRDQLAQKLNGHSRQPTTTAHLAAAWRSWLLAAHDEKAVSTTDAAELWRDIWKLLTESGSDQKDLQGSLHPADHFLGLLRSSLVSGRGNVQTIDGEAPEAFPKLCGWRNGQPLGECVGWVDEGRLYLEMDTAYGVANAQGLRNGEGLAVTKKTLVKRLDERGLIVVKDAGRGRGCRVPKIRVDAVAIPLNAIFAHAEGGTLPPLDQLDQLDQK